MQVCHYFEMREHHWESFKNISSKTGRVKRVLLQFTPESWTHVRWMDPECSWSVNSNIYRNIVNGKLIHVCAERAGHPMCRKVLLCFSI